MMFDSLAGLVTARPRTLLLATLAFLITTGILGADVAGHLRGLGVTDPGSESGRAARVLDRSFPAARPDLALLVGARIARRNVDDPAIAAQGRSLAAALAKEPSVVGVTSYWATGSPGLRSRDGSQALILARIRASDESAADRVFKRLAPRYQGVKGSLTVLIGGSTAVRNAVQDTVNADLIRAEAIALPLTLLVLVLVFGSLVTALLPLGIGILAIAGTGAVLTGISAFTDVSVFAQNLTTALGLGLAIDYALLIVRRFREELELSGDPSTAVTATLRSAGRTVVFSALTVAVSLAAMLVFPMYFLRSFAYAGISVVALATIAALVPLPAALVLLGPRVNALRVPLGRRVDPAERGARWSRLAETVMRRAPLFAVGTVALLVALGLPFARVQFATVDDRQLPAGTQARTVQQAIRDHFDNRATGVISIVTRGIVTPGSDVADYTRRLSLLPEVVRVDGPAGTFQSGRLVHPADPSRTSQGLAFLSVAPAGSVEDISPQSQDLVRSIRRQAAPEGTLVAGQAAELLDTQRAIRRGLGWAIGIVVLATLVLLFLMTGSILLPVKAVVVNALSLTAMFGAVVWVFQDGHLSGLLGFTPTGFIETSLPVLMFCLAFGLSMDYGVFLLSRVKEEYDRSGDNRGAVAYGLARTGGIVTSAAAVLAIVLVSIGTSRIMNMQMLGLGVALAVVMDATVVRCLLVPSTMAIAGRATWWAPRSLRRFHRRHGFTEAPAHR